MKVNRDEEEGSCGLGKWLRLAGKRDREHLKKLKTSGMEDGKWFLPVPLRLSYGER